MQSDFDQMVKLRDVFYYILKRWRSIILFGLIGGLLLGGFTFLKSKIMTSTISNELSANLESAIEKLTDDEKKEIEKSILANDAIAIQLNSKLESLEDRYIKLNEQLANSLYLSMSDTDQFFIEFDIKVELISKNNMDQEDINESLRQLIVAYNNQFISKNFYEYIEFQTNGLVPQDQVRDLVKTAINSSDNIHVTLTAPEDVLPSLTDAVKRYVDTLANDTILLPYSFTIEMYNEVSRVDSNKKIQEEIAEINEQILNLSLEIDDCKIKLQEIEKNSISSNQAKSEISKTSVIINILLGFLLGAFLIIIWYIYKFMTSKNIFDVNALNDNLGLMTINQIYVFGDKSALRIDKWINTRYLKKKEYISNSLTDQVSYTKTLVELLIKKNNPELTESEPYKIGLVGELTDDRSAELIDKLDKDNESLSVSKLSLFPSTEIELRSMNEVNSMILIVKIHDTEISKISHFIKLATEMHKEILGVVSIECL